jgi:hypothetical protein
LAAALPMNQLRALSAIANHAAKCPETLGATTTRTDVLGDLTPDQRRLIADYLNKTWIEKDQTGSQSYG